jgi:hypothetical protein
MLRPKRVDVWRTARPPRAWASGDRIFFWESAPKLRIIAIGTLADPDWGQNDSGEKLFRVRYLSRRLRSMPTIHELRSLPIVNESSFLKAGPATTVLALTQPQAQAILSLLAARNADVAAIWPSPLPADSAPVVLDIDFVAQEGRPHLAFHLVRERDPVLVASKKEQVLRAAGRLLCEACRLDFEQAFGQIGTGCCEVHHTRPLSESMRERQTTLKDLVVLCSNCHRMIHRTHPLWSVSKLRTYLSQRS